MSSCAVVDGSFNKTTHPEYNNACVVGNPDLLTNSPLKNILSDCCQAPSKFSTDSCYFICSFDQPSQFLTYPQCLTQYRSVTVPGLPGGLANIPGNCFGDIWNNYIQNLTNTADSDGSDDDTSSDTLASATSSLLADLTTLTGTASKTSATVASTSPPASSVTTTGSAASATSTNKPSKASSGGSVSLGAVVIVGLVLFGLFV